MSQQTEQDLYARIARLAESEHFSALRVECPNVRCKAGKIRSTMTGNVYSHVTCKGRGWKPVTDLKRACWELSQVEARVDDVRFTHQWRNEQWEWYDPQVDDVFPAASAEEAQVRAAEAWLKEERER